MAECRELNSQYSLKREQVFNRFIASVLLEERRADNTKSVEYMLHIRTGKRQPPQPPTPPRCRVGLIHESTLP